MFQFQFLYINPPKAYIVQQQKVREAFTSSLIAVSQWHSIRIPMVSTIPLPSQWANWYY